MHTIGSFCRRRGMSAIFGTIIFIGIMFSAVIPMFLVMRQADTLYEKEKFEVGRLDEEKGMENMYFYLLPTIVEDEPIITLKISNRCEIAVKIIHVWINGEPRDVDCLINPTSNGELVLRELIDPESQEPVSFNIKVTTDKGNIFLPYSGTPTYNPELGGSWEMDYYIIYIMMLHPESQLHIFVKNIDTETTYFDYNVDNNEPGYEISVTEIGEYQIIVTKLYGKPSEEVLTNTNRSVGPTNPMALVII
ncbi:MAG TPA: hypothetical protein VMW03_04225 [Candidatus Krumholzibacteriaceae bacterium]|nr:hypothetical protein [Candidatus Krumholzibacteriaceae bacterium]